VRPIVSWESADDNAPLAAVLNHHGPTRVLSKSLFAGYNEKASYQAKTRHRTSKYLTNIIEADHGALKPVIGPARGFQTMETAAATMKGLEVLRLIGREHCLTCKPYVKDEVRFVNRLFDIFDIAA
jgi:transposase-like protein